MTKQFTLAALAEKTGAELRGDGSTEITGVNTLKDAAATEIGFLANASYRPQLADTHAAAVIVSPDVADDVPCAALVLDNPYLGFALVTQMFDNRPQGSAGIHPSAVIADTAVIGNNVSIGANVVIGEHCHIGDDCEIGTGTVMNAHCVVGQGCLLNANVTLYHNVVMGDRVRIQSGAVIGGDGFGFAPANGKWTRIAQLGGVKIGNDVEIGANTCIDRGALGNTVIGDNVIIDNLIQIAHNVQIGDGSALAGNVGIAGSATIGKNCTVAGGAGISGHITLCDGVHVAAMALISKSITEPGAYGSGTAQMPFNEWRRAATRFRQLDSIAKRLQQLEKGQKGKS